MRDLARCRRIIAMSMEGEAAALHLACLEDDFEDEANLYSPLDRARSMLREGEAGDGFDLTMKQRYCCEVYVRSLDAKKALDAAGYRNMRLQTLIDKSPCMMAYLELLMERKLRAENVDDVYLKGKVTEVLDKAIAQGKLKEATEVLKVLKDIVSPKAVGQPGIPPMIFNFGRQD